MGKADAAGAPSSYDRILGILCSVLNAYSAVLFLPAEEASAGGDRVHYVASGFSLGDSLDFSAEIREGMGPAGWILRHREPLLIANFDRRKNYLGYYAGNEEQHIKAFMGCALPDTEGALCVDSKRQYSFSEQDQKMLHLFADLIARLGEDIDDNEERRQTLRYYAGLRAVYDLRRRHSRWAEFLRRYLELMAGLTGFSYALLCTRGADGKNYCVEGENYDLLLRPGVSVPVFSMSSGIVGWVFRNGAPLRSDGPDGSPETLLLGREAGLPQFQTVSALPLVIQRRTRGVLCLAHEVPLRITSATQDFMRMAADHMALFLENLFVKCRLRDLHREAENRFPETGHEKQQK
ncbi:MAG: GAF domain-containing protein [Desulfovibrio sp.]|jgi:GAF domain-containing protein|nr:GAF domain-containing protein [Desulfovibrio sp.]